MTRLIALAISIFVFAATLVVVQAQTTSPTTSPTASPTPTTTVPRSAPSTGFGN